MAQKNRMLRACGAFEITAPHPRIICQRRICIYKTDTEGAIAGSLSERKNHYGIFLNYNALNSYTL